MNFAESMVRVVAALGPLPGSIIRNSNHSMTPGLRSVASQGDLGGTSKATMFHI